MPALPSTCSRGVATLGWTMAAEQGMLRPFLILVSMSPGCRNQATLPSRVRIPPPLAPMAMVCVGREDAHVLAKVATSLGFTLVTEPFFGDPHKEAEMILFRRQAAPQRCDARTAPIAPSRVCALSVVSVTRVLRVPRWSCRAVRALSVGSRS